MIYRFIGKSFGFVKTFWNNFFLFLFYESYLFGETSKAIHHSICYVRKKRTTSLQDKCKCSEKRNLTLRVKIHLKIYRRENVGGKVTSTKATFIGQRTTVQKYASEL
jgi:hypothetical protein